MTTLKEFNLAFGGTTVHCWDDGQDASRHPRGTVHADTRHRVHEVAYINDEEIEAELEHHLPAKLSRVRPEVVFARGQFYVEAAALTDKQLANMQCLGLLTHAAKDRSFGPEKTSLVLARKIACRDAFVLNRRGHSVALEHAD